MRIKVAAFSLLMVLVVVAGAWAQTPRVVRYGGIVRDAAGAPRTGAATLTFAIYAEATGGAALWSEVQTVTLDAGGRYAVLLGAGQADGLPLELFASGEARWLGVSVDGSAEQARTALVSVPYALKAADAETVGGKPVSAFVLAGQPTVTGGAVVAPAATNAPGGTTLPLANSGTAGYIGKFTNTTDLGNSVIYQDGSNRIGVGTTVPAAAFNVAGTSAPAAFMDVYVDGVLGALPMVNRAARGTPAAPAAVQTDDILGGLAVRAFDGAAFSGGQGQMMFKAAATWTPTSHPTYLQLTTTPVNSVSPAPERLRIDSRGYVGIGTSTPSSMLHVAGDAVVDGNIAAKYQDVAEWVESGTVLTPGTVVVVDPGVTNGVRPSGKAYDVGVAGAVSAQPGLVLGEKGANKSLIAQSGRVKVKVDARYGAVKAGDLLVTSPTAGYAMKSRPVRVGGVAVHRPGTIVGKALEPLKAGKGEILVLLTLQ